MLSSRSSFPSCMNATESDALCDMYVFNHKVNSKFGFCKTKQTWNFEYKINVHIRRYTVPKCILPLITVHIFFIL